MITIALAQSTSHYLNKQKNLLTIEKHCIEGKSKFVDLIIYPELFLTGYEIEEYVPELAEPLDGPSIKKIKQLAKEYGIGIIFGFPEREYDNFFNTSAYINKNGEIEDVYRKVHLFKWENNVFTPGNKLSSFSVENVNLSMMMTFDAGFPEMARVAALNGAEMVIVLAAHVVPYQVYHKTMMSARALENQIFLAITNKIGTEKDIVYFGESAIITPYGDYLNKVSHGEKLIIETVDISLVHKIRKQQPMKYLTKRNVSFFKQHGLCRRMEK